MPGQSHLTPKHLAAFAAACGADNRPEHDPGPYLVGHTVEEVERRLVMQTLTHHHGNRTYAARALGISVRTLRNKIRVYRDGGVAVPAGATVGNVDEWAARGPGRPRRRQG